MLNTALLWIEKHYSLLEDHRSIVIAIAVLIAVISSLMIIGLQVDADFLSLLNPNDKAVKDYKYMTNNFGSTDNYVLLLKHDNLTDPNVQSFISRLKNLDSVETVSAFDTKYLFGGETDNGYRAVILVKPGFKPTELRESKILSSMISKAVKEFRLDVGITGSYQVLSESSHSISIDMSRAAIITILGISVFLLIVLRLPFTVLAATAGTLILTLCITFAVTKVIFGRLNFLTATLPSVILGLGVDYSLHIIYAFNEKAVQLINSADVKSFKNAYKEEITNARAKTFRPIFASALTTVAAFLALCFAQSRGLVEMGLVGAIGIVSALLVTIMIQPVLLSFIPIETIAKIRRTEGLWTRLLNSLYSRGKPILIVTAAGVIIGLLSSGRVSFSADQNKLIDGNITSLSLQNDLLKRYHFSPVPIIFISPDAETNKKKFAFLQAQESRTFAFIQNSLTAGIFHQNPNDFLGKDGSYLTLAYPSENPFDPSVFEKIRSSAEQVQKQFSGSGNIVTGSVFLNFGLNKTIKTDLIYCTVVAFVFVFAAVYSSFRSLRKAVISMLPVVTGTILTVGLMGLLHIDFNVMTVVVLPLLIGTGIDDGVHIQYNWYRENRNTIRAVSGIASAVVATTLTSVIAFGSLISARNPGFRELGLVTSAGLGFCLIVSLVVLPCILNMMNKTGKEVIREA